MSTASKAPKGIEPKEWRYACERAGRAKVYAEKMPEFVRASDLKFQDPMWQWENEVKDRFTNPVGGSLSGTRP